MFRYCETKKISTENRDITLLSIKFFDTRNQWNPKGFPYEFFRHCETKNFPQKIGILPCSPPPLIHKFLDTRNFAKHRRVPLRTFSVLWDKTFLTENRDTRPLLSLTFFGTRNFLKHKGSSTKFFGTVRQKFFNGKSWYLFAWSTEISGRIDVCKNSLKTNIKQVVLFLNVCKSWSKYL